MLPPLLRALELLLLLQALLGLALLHLGIEFLGGIAPTLDGVREPVALRWVERGGDLVLQLLEDQLGAVGRIAAQAAQFLSRLIDHGPDLVALIGRRPGVDLVDKALHELRAELFGRGQRAPLRGLLRRRRALLLQLLLQLLLIALLLRAQLHDQLGEPLLLLLALVLLLAAFVLHALKPPLSVLRHRDASHDAAGEEDSDERQGNQRDSEGLIHG